MEDIKIRLQIIHENQKELEGILMEEIKKESSHASSEKNIISELATTLIELWKLIL